jgi:ADP-heptose:LPS heptosyltransferase
MHILTITTPIDRISADNVIQPGTYYCEDVMGGQLLVMAGGGVMRPLEERRVPVFAGDVLLASHFEQPGHEDEIRDEVGKPCASILIGRTGGLGDLTLLTPVLREIKRRWPSVRIAVASIRELQQSIQNLPFIDELLQYPVSKEVADTYDGWIWLENAIERNEDAKTLHSVDCVAKFIGLTLPEDCNKLQAYVVTEQERAWVKWAHPRISGVRRLCIQTHASAHCRTYPQQKLNMVITDMLKKGWEVFLLAGPGEIKQPPQSPPGLRIVADNATFRQRAALVDSADCLLAPDSSLAHVAGALAVPCVALYGVFPWEVRTKYAPTTKALTGTGFKCNPCFFHNTPGKHFPDNCPTKAKGVCGVMDAIEPQYIAKKIEEIARPLENVVEFKA